MPSTSKKALLSLVDAFPQSRIMVVGDVMIDHFIWGTVNRISPEAPVPVVAVTKESLRLGGAANVIQNIWSLGGTVYSSGIIGNDEMGREIVHKFRSLNISTEGIVVADERPTTVKTRIIGHNQQVVRFDREVASPVNADSSERIIAHLKKGLPRVNVIIISDYGKGVVTTALVEEILALSSKENKPVLVDPKVENIRHYKGVTIITPNQHEAGEATGIKIISNDDARKAAALLQEKIGCASVLITRGEHGMTLLDNNGRCTHIPTLATEVYDVTGAGDTVISVFALALSIG
ncbi:MAG: bifunctional hydroxymethylpyrimidine kinase/phosphomethylpyrimidine kinase, partial [Deltaproteobacteria bacterium]|nr:bifunctional hydroxymethylpyrimidine kinase/phosphomethylpyrimidine kinase [Deltaproteobacteria bacterium]